MISLIEKMTLISLQKNDQSLLELSNDLGLSENLCSSILEALHHKQLIVFNGKYSLNLQRFNELSQEIKKEYREIENNQIMQAFQHVESAHFFEPKRYSLSQKDRTLLNGMLKNIELFLESCKKEKNATQNESIIFWGHASLGQATKGVLATI